MAGVFGKVKQRLSKISGKMEKYQEAITFAEAGESEDAAKAVTLPTEKQTPTKLLVMGRESTFSKEIIDYALEMAQRMSYDILALNTAPLSCETFKLFSSSHSKVCENFKSLSEENARRFREAAEAKKIPFEHVVMFSESEEALESISRKDKNISFVISETVEDREANRIEEGERLQHSLFVYAMV